MPRSRLLLAATCICAVLVSVAVAENATVATACFKGKPQSALFADITVIENDGYIQGFSRETRRLIWASFKLTKLATPHDASRPNKDFETDTHENLVVTRHDYTNSGYDRGHMAPSSGIGKCHGKNALLASSNLGE